MKKELKQLLFGMMGMAGIFLASCEKYEDEDEFTVTQPPLNISMTRGGSLIAVPDKNNFSVDEAKTYAKVPLGISLSTVTLDSFTVEVGVNKDTINQMINKGTLTNAVLLSESEYTLPDQVTVPANTISAPLNLLIDFNALLANPGKKLALAIRLSNPSSHTLASSKSTTVVVIDVDKAIDASELGDVTAKYLKNTGPTWQSSVRQSGNNRWGNLDDWTANAAARSHGGVGGYSNDGSGFMNLEAGWGSPAIYNGKLYQTTTLPAGKYAFEVTQWDWKGMIDPAYLVVAEGTEIPNITALEGNTLGHELLASSKVEFTLTERAEVSLGIVVNFPDTGQGFKIKQLKLTRLE